MKIHVLMENTSCSPEFTAEHGLSLFIESEGRCVLFDFGASPSFADNARRMGVDLNRVDMAVLSHGHYDHGGGLPHFLEINEHAPVWVSPYAFETHLNAAGKNIGLDSSLQSNRRLCFTPGEIHPLFPGVTLYSAASVSVPYGVDSAGMLVSRLSGNLSEDFLHEQYLLLEEQGKRVLFSGCSHRGILNIATYFRADVLVGGFHFVKWDTVKHASALEHAAERLLSCPTRYFTGHCTGAEPFRFLKKRMGERLTVFSAGQTLTI